VTDDCDARLGAMLGTLSGLYAATWTPGQRARLLDVVDREFPDLVVATVAYLRENG